MRSNSIQPGKPDPAPVPIKKRLVCRPLIFLKFNVAKNALYTIVSLKKTDNTSFASLDDSSFDNPRILPLVWLKNKVTCFFTKNKPRKHSRNHNFKTWIGPRGSTRDPADPGMGPVWVEAKTRLGIDPARPG